MSKTENLKIKHIKTSLITPIACILSGWLLGYSARIFAYTAQFQNNTRKEKIELTELQKNIVSPLFFSLVVEKSLFILLVGLFLKAKKQVLNKEQKTKEEIEREAEIILKAIIDKDPSLKAFYSQLTIDIANILLCLGSSSDPMVGLSVALVKICLSRACSELSKASIIDKVAVELKEKLIENPDFGRIFLAQCSEDSEREIANEILEKAKSKLNS